MWWKQLSLSPGGQPTQASVFQSVKRSALPATACPWGCRGGASGSRVLVWGRGELHRTRGWRASNNSKAAPGLIYGKGPTQS